MWELTLVVILGSGGTVDVVVDEVVLDWPGSQMLKFQKPGSVMGADSGAQNTLPDAAPLLNVT